MTERHVEWASPAALWDHFNGPTDARQRRVFRTPALLRFAKDDFMQDFLDVMHNDPRRIASMLAVPETWRKPAAEVEVPRVRGGVVGLLTRARTAAVRRLEARQGIVRTSAWNSAEAQPLKLYQPAHQRYYLVTASLICRVVGMPDRALDTTADERVTFVLRLLQPPSESAVNPDPAECTELALVGDEWKPLADAATLADGETRYPLSPLTYGEIDGRRRRVFNGLIPVAKREALVAAKMPDPGSTTAALTPLDGRRMLLKTQVVGPWSQIPEIAVLAQQQTATVDAAPDPGAVAATRKTANEQIQTISWYVLLDLDGWLEENVPELHAAVKSSSPAGLSGTKLSAYQKLQAITRGGTSLVAALNAIRPHRSQLETVTSVYVTGSTAWPAFLFPFVTATMTQAERDADKAERAELENVLAAALDQPLPGTVPIAPRSVAEASATVHRSPWFTVRCVFERPSCPALQAPVVSEPTASFKMAAFFDPDAPARASRIAMPTDTTPAGLRKFDKNTAFVLSDVLCGQISAARSLTFGDLIRAVLPWPLHKDLGISPSPCTDGGDSAGMVCSFSIPIITICALILLMIFVKLLDIVFFWMPFFQICLPVPKLDAKLEVKAEVGP